MFVTNNPSVSAKNPHRPVCLNDAIVIPEVLLCLLRFFINAFDEMVVVWMHRRQVFFKGQSELPRVETKDPPQFVRPLHLASNGVIIPTANASDSLCFAD